MDTLLRLLHRQAKHTPRIDHVEQRGADLARRTSQQEGDLADLREFVHRHLRALR